MAAQEALLAGWGSVSALIPGEQLNPDGNKQNIGRILAYKLGGQSELPAPPPLRARAEPPPAFGDDVLIEDGRIRHQRNCLGCHGASVSGGVLPDLPYTPIQASAESWRAVVIDGILADKGTLSLAENLSPA